MKTNPTHILHLLNYPGQGGSEKYILDIIDGLKADYRFSFAYSQEGPLLAQLRRRNIKLYSIPMRNPLDWKAAKQLAQLCREQDIQVIHAHYLRENLIALMSKRFGNPAQIIWTYHVNVPMSLPIRLLNRMVTKQNKQVIAVSHFMKGELMKRGVSPDKITVVYNGCTLPQPTSIIERPEQTFIFGVVARLSAEKGHAFLLDALASLHASIPAGWKCWIIGDGPDREVLQQQAKELGIADHLLFWGHQKEIVNYYAAIDCIIIPSENESLSYTAIEALIMQKPVIATNVGGIPEVIHHGITGTLVEYGDVEDLAMQMAAVISEPEVYQRIAENGARWVEEQFSSAQMLEKLKQIYG